MEQSTTFEDDMRGDCGVCGEEYDCLDYKHPSRSEVGEFYDPSWPDDQPSVIAHAQCGLDMGWELA